MSKQTINIGASPNDGTGTPLRTSFDYTNQNFTELYTAVGPSGNNIVVPGNATITGDLTVRTTKLAVTSTGAGFGTATPGTSLEVWKDLIRVNSDVASGIYGTQFWRSGVERGRYGFDFSASLLELQADGDIRFLTGGENERLRIDSTGIVGIGVTPSAWGSSYKAVQLTGGVLTSYVNGTIAVIQNSYDTAAGAFRYVAAASSPASFYQQFNGGHEWSNASAGTAGNLINGTGSWTSRMTLDASGNLLVNTTSQILSGKVSLQTAGTRGYSYNDTTGTAGTKAIIFGSLGVEVGNIAITTLATTYNSISDYRLKEAVQPLVGGLARVSALKPSIYKWKVNGSDGEGFLAHELASVVSAAVTGEKDAVNEDGSIKAQSIDMSRIVPILVAAIQELTARVQTLEAR